MTIKQQGGVFGRNPTFNNVEVDGDATFKDGAKAIFGDGGDLQIYHSGASSTIYDAGTGALNILSNQVVIKNAASTKNGAVFNENADARFFYDGVFKAATTAAGFSVTGNVALTDGGGIDFSATAGTGTSELFDDYEEGTWTPNQGAGLTVVGTFSSSGIYTKVGRTVDLIGEVNGSTSILIGSTAAVICTNLPFFSSAVCTGNMSNSSVNQDGGLVSSGLILYSSTTMSSTTTIRFSITYIT